jgi:hypothetical protein
MKKTIWIIIALTVLVPISTMWLFRNYANPPAESGFKMISLQNNALLISESDILSYNWTSHEMAISDEASQRLLGYGDSLYSFTGGFVIRIDGEELYRGVFRAIYMSAIPAPPKISILFPAIFYPSSTENPKALIMFYPSGEPQSNQTEANKKLFQYFEKTNKLTFLTQVPSYCLRSSAR